MLDVRRPHRPLLRLLAAGGALALLVHALADDRDADGDASRRIVIDASRIAEAERGIVATTGRAPDAAERAALLLAELDDEILYREARRLGLDDGDTVVQHRIAGNLAFVEDGPPPGSDGTTTTLAGDMLQHDVVVRRRLIERMRAQLEREALADEPGDAELATALASNAARFSLPARVRLALLSVPTDGTGDHAADATRAPEVDRAAVQELPAQSERDLARLYGAAFARAAFEAPPGGWTDPVAAIGGRYRILVREREPARLPPLDEVRNQVRELVRRERAAAAVRRKLDAMRAGYAVSLVASPTESPG